MRYSIRYRLVAGTVAALLFGPGMATPAFAMGRHVVQRTQPVSITHLDHTHHAVALESSLEQCAQSSKGGQLDDDIFSSRDRIHSKPRGLRGSGGFGWL
jgi:hypothetical protein